MSGKKDRKRWSAAEKMRIVLAGPEPGVEVSDLCRQEGLNPTMYYTWKRILLGAAERVIEKKESKVSAREERLSKENGRMKDVVAEITARTWIYKKRSRPRGSWPGSPGTSAESACHANSRWRMAARSRAYFSTACRSSSNASKGCTGRGVSFCYLVQASSCSQR